MAPRVAANPVEANGVAANLVVGSDGSTTLAGNSAGLSTSADRRRFHVLRKGFNAILIGGNTAAHEPYATTPLPLIVLSTRPLSGQAAKNPQAIAWNKPMPDAISDATNTYGRVLIEAGPSFLREAITTGLVSDLYLTISPISGGENRIDLTQLTSSFEEISRESIEGTLFLHYGLAPSHD